MTIAVFVLAIGCSDLPSTATTSQKETTSTKIPVATTPVSSTLLPTVTANQPGSNLTPTPSPTAIFKPAHSEEFTPIFTPLPTPTPRPKPTTTLIPSLVPTPTPYSTPSPLPRFPSCGSEAIFTASPVDIDTIYDVITLGNLNPPGHVFPSDHGGFYIARPDLNRNEPTEIVTLFSPGNLTVTRIRATEYVNAGTSDYQITLQSCEEITVELGHVGSLSANLFGDTSSYGGWRSGGEYTTGGETHRIWSKDYDISVAANEVLGTVGGRPRAWAFDFSLFDFRHPAENTANMERWQENRSIYGACYLRYYEKGPVLDRIVNLVHRDTVAGEDLPCDTVMQDVPGTAKGAWLLLGVENINPEDPHLALVHWNTHPSQRVFSVGTSMSNLDSGVYAFLPVSEGLMNRDFADIIPDGQTYGFRVDRFGGIIIVQMPDSDTLWIEALIGATTDPSSWVFTEDMTVFVR